jgi:hypothetical protein
MFLAVIQTLKNGLPKEKNENEKNQDTREREAVDKNGTNSIVKVGSIAVQSS